MNVMNTIETVELPYEILAACFSYLSPRDLAICSAVSQIWQNITNQDKLWNLHVISFSGMYISPEISLRQIYISRRKAEFFKYFSAELKQALGGKKFETLPYQHIRGIRFLENESITLNEFYHPVTIGSVSAIPMHLKSKVWKESDVTRYAFFAVRFINREFDPYADSKHLNIWVTNGKMWTMLKGSRQDGWPTWFCREDGTGMDFSRTIEYVGRLMRGEPCGVRVANSSVEHSKLTIEGKSTVELV